MSVERWEIAISQTLLIRSKENLRTKLRPTITLRQWSNLSEIKSNMAAAAILKNGYDILILPVGGSSLTKFCIPMQNDMSMTTIKWKSKPKVQFQYVGRLFSEIGNSYILAMDLDISSKVGMLIDFDLLKRVPSLNLKL